MKAVNKVLQKNVAPEPVISTKENHAESNSLFLYFLADRKMVKIFFHEILFIESLKDYIKIVTTNKTIVTKYVLYTLEKMLPPGEFLRIHRSYIVAINKIDSYNADSIQIAKHEIPIGKIYKIDVIRRLNAASAEN